MFDGNHAVLEVEFKVMVRPKKAMEAVHAQMQAMLETLSTEA